MNFFERLRIAYETFRRVGGINLPDGNGKLGRSSDESLGGNLSLLLNKYQDINPVISFEMLELLKKLWIYNPDVSQFVANLQNLANNGHSIQVSAASESVAAAAVATLNEGANRIYKNGAGVDGLINAYLAQIAWSGALSSEDIVNFAGRRVEHTVIVPVESIRFRFDPETQSYIPFQRTSNPRKASGYGLNLIELNPETYSYSALQTVENIPYAKPPATAAVEAIINGQEPMMENLRYIIQKFGLLGLVTASVMPPSRKPNETEGEYQARATSYLSMVAKSLEGQFSKGLLVSFRDQKIEHTNVSEGAAGVYDINRVSEEQIMSGLGMQPAFFGRTDSTTETYADVVYNLLLAQVHNIQRVVKRRHEKTLRLDLRLKGVNVDSVSMIFNKPFSRNAKADAEREEIEIRNVLEKVRAGLISADEGAQELGYESWHDEKLLDTDASLVRVMLSARARQTGNRYKLKFDRLGQRYVFQRETLQLLSGKTEPTTLPGNVVDLKKKTLLKRV